MLRRKQNSGQLLDKISRCIVTFALTRLSYLFMQARCKSTKAVDLEPDSNRFAGSSNAGDHLFGPVANYLGSNCGHPLGRLSRAVCLVWPAMVARYFEKDAHSKSPCGNHRNSCLLGHAYYFHECILLAREILVKRNYP